MLPATIDEYNATVGNVNGAFTVRITSAYRSPIHNLHPVPDDPTSVGARESPHIYGRGLDLAPNQIIFCSNKNARALRAKQMELLFNAAPSPKLLEAAAKILDPRDTADDGTSIFDPCSRGGADHVHVGSGYPGGLIP